MQTAGGHMDDGQTVKRKKKKSEMKTCWGRMNEVIEHGVHSSVHQQGYLTL